MRVGVLGGGQLGQMLTLAGHPLGIDVGCFDASLDVPASHGGTVTAGNFTDVAAVEAWATDFDVVTYEWENIPVELVANVAERKLVRPGPKALAIAQDRVHEKKLMSALDIPITPFRVCANQNQLRRAIVELGSDVVVKSRTGGYDGRRQITLRSFDSSPEGDTDEAQLKAVNVLLEHGDVVVEQFVDFDFEASIIGARSTDGDIVTYPATLNTHSDGILRTSIIDTDPSHGHVAQGADLVAKILHRLEYVGVLTLELFSVGGRLLGNEIAPRVHNSGHWTIEGAETSQFENHLRAICGLPPGSTANRCHAAMINIIGAAHDATGILEVPGACLHTYQKQPRAGRKLGHVTVTAPDHMTLLNRIEQVEKLLNS